MPRIIPDPENRICPLCLGTGLFPTATAIYKGFTEDGDPRLVPRYRFPPCHICKGKGVLKCETGKTTKK